MLHSRDELVRLASVADAVRGKHTQSVPLDRWEEPKHAHLLRSPAAFVDQVMNHLNDDGSSGDCMPWAKTHRMLKLRPHEMTIWAGSNGSAKSTVLSEIMLSLAMAGRRVVVVSLEMPAYKVASKMAIQAFANRHPSKTRVQSWADSLGESLCFLDMTGDLSPNDTIKLIRWCAHEMKTQHVLIDNLTKILSADNDHAEQQRQFVAQAHRTAIDTGMHVHLVAHTRKPSGEEDKPPSRYEVAGSRTIIDQPDNVVMVWRNRPKEEKVSKGEFGQADKADLVLKIDKQRHGDHEGAVSLWMDRECYRFVGDYADRAMSMVA